MNGNGPVPAFWDCRRLIKQSPLPAAQKHLLSVLHEFAGEDRWAFPHQTTLAAACGWGLRQLQRHLAALVAADLVATERRQTGNRYAIAWETLSGLVPTEAAPSPKSLPPRRRRRVPSDTADTSDTTSATPITSTEHPSERLKNIPGEDVASTRGVMWKDGGLRSEEFASLDQAGRRFDEAVAKAHCRPEDRLRFLTLWAYVDRRRRPGGERPPIRNPGGFFAQCLSRGDWAGAAVDEDRVRKWLKEHERPQSVPLRSALPPFIADRDAAPQAMGDLMADFRTLRAAAWQRAAAASARSEVGHD